jgi:hypothetical protein
MDNAPKGARVGWGLISAFAAIALTLIEALAYTYDQMVGDMASWVMFVAALFCAWLVGSINWNGNGAVSALAGFGVASIILGANVWFLGWYRVEALENFNPSSWVDFERVYSFVCLAVQCLAAATALVAARLAGKSTERRTEKLVLPGRIELPTSALPRMRSTTELRQRFAWLRRGLA